MGRSIKVPYGDGHLSFEVDPARRVNVLRPRLAGEPREGAPSASAGGRPERATAVSEEEIIAAALAAPIDSPPLSELARGKKKVVLVTSDHTRPLPSRLTLPPMLRAIRQGAPQAEITIIVGVGSHRGMTDGEMREKFGAELVRRERVINHDPRDPAGLVSLGSLPSGGELVLNRQAAEADLLLADGFIEPHQFAGFSGGRKSILPGVAGLESVLASHNAEFTVHPNSRPGVLEGNLFHLDMLHAARQAGLSFILNVALSPDKRVIAAFAGHPERAHLAGCRYVRGLCAVPAVEAPLVVASNGGYPLDQNIYQSTKSVMAADLVCAPGGVIIAVNECRDGHGAESFYNDFKNASSLASLLEEIRKRKRNQTRPDQWVTQLVADIISRHRVIYVTAAPPAMLRELGLGYAESIGQALEQAAVILGRSDAPITVLPEAVTLILEKQPSLCA